MSELLKLRIIVPCLLSDIFAQLELLLESVCNSVKLPQERDCSAYCTLFVLVISQQYRYVNVSYRVLYIVTRQPYVV